MTPRLLVSVRNAAEAKICVKGLVDIIDVKEPNNGGLGNAGTQVWREVAAVLPPDIFGSVAMGELSHRSTPELSLEEQESLRNISFAKTGLAHASENWRNQWSRWRLSLPHNVQAVAVAYADWKNCNAPSPEEVLENACGDANVFLIDTFDKSNGPIQFATEELRSIGESCRELRLPLAIAGGLRLDTIGPAIENLQPDIIAVRGAACHGDRTGDITDVAAIQRLKALIAQTRCDSNR